MRTTRNDLTNQTFGHLTVIGPRRSVPYGKTQRRFASEWFCRCQCGNEVWRRADSLLQGTSDSCGCLQKERTLAKIHLAHEAAAKANFKHGQSKNNYLRTRLYRTWVNMKRRCQYPQAFEYKYYGARGIRVCEEWQNFEPFAQFAKENGYTDSLTIDRINNDGNYEPSNCRFIPQKAQNRNTRRTVRLTPTLSLSEFCEAHGIAYDLGWHTLLLYKKHSLVWRTLVKLIEQMDSSANELCDTKTANLE